MEKNPRMLGRDSAVKSHFLAPFLYKRRINDERERGKNQFQKQMYLASTLCQSVLGFCGGCGGSSGITKINCRLVFRVHNPYEKKT